eukprot:685291-Prymnesium_polylepis.1
MRALRLVAARARLEELGQEVRNRPGESLGVKDERPEVTRVSRVGPSERRPNVRRAQHALRLERDTIGRQQEPIAQLHDPHGGASLSGGRAKVEERCARLLRVATDG